MIKKQSLKSLPDNTAVIWACGHMIDGVYKFIDVFIDRKSAFECLVNYPIITSPVVEDHARISEVRVNAEHIFTFIKRPTYMGYISLCLAADSVSTTCYDLQQ